MQILEINFSQTYFAVEGLVFTVMHPPAPFQAVPRSQERSLGSALTSSTWAQRLWSVSETRLLPGTAAA